MKKRILIGCFAAIGVLVLILDAETAVNAAREAVVLCVNVVIPSLFPFFVLINLLSSSMTGARLRWLSPLEKLLKIPQGSASLFVSGLLGGYPTGAQLVHRAWKDGIVHRDAATRMIAFCSNAGPAFIFGIIAPMFSDRSVAWLIWGIHILSAVLVGSVFKQVSCKPYTEQKTIQVSLNDALRRSVAVMSSVCGWIVLFRVIAAFSIRWFLWYVPTEIQVAFIAVLELANGCTALDLIQNEGLRMIIATAAVNFGGICVLMQTVSVTNGLQIGTYVKGKFLQAVFSVLISVFVQSLLFAEQNRVKITPITLTVMLLIPALFVYFGQSRKNNSSFSRRTVV